MSIPLSILDLAPVGAGMTAREALGNSTELAQAAERLGYTRYWFAEHHGMPSIASSAPEILIAHTAANTSTMRVGSGGIMLQNHVPLRAAEAFHTLEALHPGRIDLGIGRAPGTDPTTSAALHPFNPAQFAEQLHELIGLSRGTLPQDHPFHRVRVIPADVSLPPIWLLGSSGASARFAGELGIGYSFASHFSSAPAAPAIEAYKAAFRPSETFPQPHAILGAAVICAETHERAEYLASSFDLMWVRINRGEFKPIPTPEEAITYPYTHAERSTVAKYRSLLFVGTPTEVKRQIEQAVTGAGADEVIVTSTIHSHAERMKCFELLAEVFGVKPRNRKQNVD